MNKYLFEGETVKLTAKDYYRMLDLYPNLDLTKELEQLDFELRDKRKWWSELNAKLNYRNKVAYQQKARGELKKIRDSLEDQINDRSWAN